VIRFWRARRRKRVWPQVENRAGVLGRGDIKEVTLDEVERMARQAKAHHWSGKGAQPGLMSIVHQSQISTLHSYTRNPKAAFGAPSQHCSEKEEEVISGLMLREMNLTHFQICKNSP
jgi:hypothetical protein